MATIHDRLARLSPEQRAQIAGRLSKRNEAPQADPPSLPMAKPDPDHRFDPFPLTEIQQAYWIGRSGAFEMGQVAAHSYLELEDAFDLDRLNASLRAMIDRHDMLRVVILPSGQQQTQHSVPPYQIAVTDLRGLDAESVEARLTAIRHRMSHQLLPTDRYPLFEFHASLLDGGRVRLNMSMDALIFDGWSISLFLREWARLYHDPELRLPELQLTFRDYVLAEQAIGRTDGHRRDRDYWVERVKKMPPGPDLPVAKNPAELASGRFVRRTGRLEPAQWTRLKERAKGAGLTTPGLLLAAYAEVIGLWSQSRQFTINVPRFNRLPLHPQIEGMIGEAASFTLVAIDLDGDEGFEARARRLQQRLWDDLDHALFTGVSVLRELSKLRGSAGALMPVVFTSAPQDSDGRDAYATLVARDLGDVVFAINQTPQVWLDNHVSEQHGALVCDWDWVEELLPPGMSEAMLDAYMRFLERLATEPAAWKLSWTEQARHIMPPEQLARRREINSRTAPIPDVLLHELFARQVPLRGDAPAVIAVDRRLSYRELFRFSNQWGHRLRDAGVKPGDRVAIVMEKGWEQIVAVFAVLQAGAAYVPIDPDQPAERLAYMIGDSESACVLTQASLDARLQWPERPRRLCLDLDAVAALNPEPLPPTQRPEDPAYVIYTSGSTGAPKGVVVSHRNVVNVVACTNARFEIGPDDRAFAVTVLHHDLAVYDIFGLLAAGGAIVIPEQAGRRDPAHWAEVIGREGVTLWNSVPAIMVMLLDYAETHPRAVPASLRLVILGGDWVPVDLPGRLAGCNAATRLLCIGGPTETTIWNIWYPVARVEPSWKSIPYGQPFANNSYHIFGDGWVPRPDWVPGEQYCGGAQLAIGYWRDAERTAAKFMREPRTGERLYRTGDLGRYLPDGNIEFIGRADFQVKINGQRIELGEIEAALRQHPNVRAAVVSVTSSGAKRLVAYVVPNIGASIVAAELRDFVAGKLPEHMLPSFFVPLDQLPLTPNGKVDRKSLPEPRSERSEAAVERRAEDSGTVDQVRRLVAGILQVETVDVDANLLALGANSIDMVRIGNEIEKAFGFRPRMDQIFRLQSARAIADYCDGQLGRTPGKVKDVAAAGMDDELRSIIASFGNLILPAERDAFKDKEPGIRRDDDGRAFVALTPPVVDDALLDRYRNRRSHRRFALKPIPVEQFGRLLACLYQVKLDGKPKYLWPSPGGLYPMQVYLHVKAGRVQGVQAGTYYYHPIKHRLVCLTANVEIDRTIHVPFVNTPVFDEAAFSIFLVSQLAAIAPAYGESSVNFARIEAGILAVLLEQAARDCGLGLCQIGGIDFDRIRPMFQLDKSHLFVHSLLGGAPSSEDASAGSKAAAADAEAARAAQLLERVRQLSPEEARSMLSALKGTGPKVPT